jgi:hypothetical protein
MALFFRFPRTIGQSMKTTSFILAILFFPILCLSVSGGHGGDAATTILSVPDQYSTIQAAIDVAGTGDIIHIATGDYYEQLLITDKTLTLSGETGAVLHATAGLSQTLLPWTSTRALLGILRSRVTVTGLTIDGDRQGSAYTSGGLQGLFYIGSSGRLENCTIKGFRGTTLSAYSSARALILWNPEATGAPEMHVEVINNRFEDNEASITIAGDDGVNPAVLRTTFAIERNTITGFGPAPLAADGIAIYTGAGGVVRGNVIANHAYTGTGDPYSSGINAFDGQGDSRRDPPRFIPVQPIRFEGNTFLNNDDHLVLINAPGSEVVNNTFTGRGPSGPRWGALALSGQNIRVTNNDFSDTPTGIFLFGDDRYFNGWPLVGIATGANLNGNWFSNVTQRVRVPPPVTGLQEQGTAEAPFRSIISSPSWDAAGFHATIRNWHSPFVIESSGDLRTWVPIHTNDIALPVVGFSDPSATVLSPWFYRARNK